MAYPMPVVIAPRRSVTLGGQSFARESLLQEVGSQSLADVRAIIRGLTFEQTRQQLRLQNPPTLLEVDGRTGKRVEDVDKRTVVLFGVMLAASAMRQVEIELASTIARSTTARSGRLGNVAASWQWVYIPKGGTPRPISSGTPPASFGIGDALVLTPHAVPYATLTNRNVGRRGRLDSLNAAGRKGREAPRAKQQRGFLFWAAEAMRKRVAFRQFSVQVVFSKSHQAPGEIMTRLGTGLLVIRARGRGVRIG